MPSLDEAIQQTKYEDLRQKLVINLLYTTGVVKSANLAALKPYGITWQQFNMMRILRGQAPKPASMRLLSERMLDPQSNASRLVDRLTAKGYVNRVASNEDKRQVKVSLTKKGERLLTDASVAMSASFQRFKVELSDEELIETNRLLDEFRTGVEAASAE